MEKLAEPYNSPLEIGIRAIILLDAIYPKSYDLSQITWMDHVLVNSADIGGPESLHPKLPQRSGEVIVRRRLIKDGLDLMRRLHMVEVTSGKEGITYKSSDEAKPLLDLMETDYSTKLKSRAAWLANYFNDFNYSDMRNFIISKLNRWNTEFDD